MNGYKIFVLTFFITVCLTVSLHAQNLWDDEGVPLRTTFALQYDWSVDKNQAGDIFTVWGDSRADRPGLYAMKYNSDGVAQWPEDVLAVYTFMVVLEICPTADGGLVVVWGREVSYNNHVLYTQKIDTDGNVLWGEEGVEIGPFVYYYGDQDGGFSRPSVVPSGDGGVIVVWVDEPTGSGVLMLAKRLLADGSLAPGWDPDGTLIAENTYLSTNYYQPPACVDNLNGAIVSYSQVSGMYVQRLDSEGTLQWGDGVVICDTTCDYSSHQVVEDDAGGAFVVWQEVIDDYLYEYDLHMQRVDDAGNVLWLANGVPLVHANDYQYSFVLEPDGFGGFLAAWVDERNSSYADLYCQRIDPNGGHYWATGGVALSLASGHQKEVAIDADGEGGLYASWISWESGNYGHCDAYVRRVTEFGQPMWLTNGMLLSGGMDNDVDQANVACTDDGALFFRKEAHDEVNGIYLQKTDEHGNFQLPGTGIPVVEDLAGCVWDDETVLLCLGDDKFLSVWIDSRRTIYGYERIYYQVFDSTGVITFPEDGAPLSTEIDAEQYNPMGTETSDGGAIIVWADDHLGNYDPKLYAQKLSQNGSQLWDFVGIEVTSGGYDEHLVACCPDEEGGAYVLFCAYDTWTMQHFDSDGNWLFGGAGLALILPQGPYSYYYLVQDGANGAIVIVDQGEADQIIAIRVLPDGQVAWEETVYDLGYDVSELFAVPSCQGGAVIAWEDTRSGWEYGVYAQKIDLHGNMLWETNGLPVATDPDHHMFDPRLVEDAEAYVYIGWKKSYADLYCQRISPEGQFMFPAEGIAVSTADGEQRDMVMTGDGEGGAIFCWIDTRSYPTGSTDLYGIHLDVLGQIADPVWSPDGSPVCNYERGQYTPRIVSDGVGGAVVTWSDSRSGGGDLYTQRIGDRLVPVEPENPNHQPGKFALQHPYPNPFNPTTTITFAIPVAELVKLDIFDVNGRRVDALSEAPFQPGIHNINFNASNLASGIYFVRLQAGEKQSIQKLILLK